MKELLTLLCERLMQNMPAVMATVVHQEGSTPRGAGSCMLVDASGLIAGTIGGGLAEAKAIQTSIEALHSRKAEIMNFTLSGEIAAQSEMICGGFLQIFIEPIFPSKESIKFFNKILARIDTQKITTLTAISDLENLSHSLCIEGMWQDEIWQNNPHKLSSLDRNALLANLAPDQESALIKGPEGENYIVHNYPPAWQIIIAGGGHVSLFTTQVAALAGFSVIVIDDREEFSKASRFPQAASTYTIPEFNNCFSLCEPTKYTCIVIVTRGHLHDKTVLSQALQTNASYIGMIGSKRKRKQIYEALLKENVSQMELNKVYCPIGLGINAETPEEIAVSIVAECIAHRRQAWDALQR